MTTIDWIILAVLTIGSICVLAALTIFLRKNWRRVDRSSMRVVVTLVLAYLVIRVSIHFVDNFFRFGESLFASVLIAPLAIARDTIPVFAAIWFVWRYRPSLNQPIAGAKLPDDPTVLREQVQKIFRSEEFLSALGTCLPKGANDKKHGLDYVPFMLENIAERRTRFAKSSKYFFVATIIAGLLFVGVVGYFARVVLNDASAGAPRLLAQIEEEVRTLNQNSQALLSQQLRDLAALENSSPGARIANTFSDTLALISASRKSGDFEKLQNNLQALQREIAGAGAPVTFSNAVNAARLELDAMLLRKEAAMPRIVAASQALTPFIADARKELEKPENRIPDLIKRVMIGVVVTTCMFAILRYLAGLYRNHYNQMMRAYAEDLALRKFYVGYKGSAESKEDRSAVIKSLVGSSFDSEKQGDGGLSLTDNEAAIVKEFFGSLAKKL